MAYYEDIIIDDKGKTSCILCNLHIPDNMRIIEDHINESHHKSLFVKRLMIQNGITIKQIGLYCNVCKDEIQNMDSLLEHIQSSLHKKIINAIKEKIENDGSLIVTQETDAETAQCLICNCAINFDLESVHSHINLEKHKRARSIVVQPLNGIFSVEGSDDHLWCKICQVYFENYVELILEHVDSNPGHKKSLGKILRLINGQNITIDKYLTDPKEDKASCLKCCTGVGCNVDNLERHIKGKRHNK